MSKQPTPAYIIQADSEHDANEIAAKHDLPENVWRRVPIQHGSREGAYIQKVTNVLALNHEEFAELSEEEQAEISLVNKWDTRLLLANNFMSAAAYAGERSWWLHSWVHVGLPIIDSVVEYQRLED